MQLNEFQNRFKDLMLDHPRTVEHPPADFAALFAQDNVPVAERLKIYRNNIVGSLTDALMATFPLMEKLVGKAFLEAMTRSFVLQHPPSQACLHRYGAGFDEFIAAFPPAVALPYLPALARLELAINDSYYAPDQDALRAQDLAQIPQDQLAELSLPLCDYVYILQENVPLIALRDFCLNPEQPAPDINNGAGPVMVTRIGLAVEVHPLGIGEYAALVTFKSGGDFGTAVTAALDAESGFDVAMFLQRHLGLQTFRQRKPDDRTA